MSKIVAIVGSPRAKGQGAAIVSKMTEVAQAEGNEVETFYLNKLEDLKGCQACMGCKKAGKCIRKDSLAPVLDAVAASDSLILVAADYFGQPCAQYRVFEDRLYGFVAPGFTSTISPKKVAIVVTAGSGAGADACVNSMSGIMSNFFKCEVVGQLIYTEADKGNFADNAEFQAKAEEIAKKL